VSRFSDSSTGSSGVGSGRDRSTTGAIALKPSSKYVH
jgi:hypothetical protein